MTRDCILADKIHKYFSLKLLRLHCEMGRQPQPHQCWFILESDDQRDPIPISLNPVKANGFSSEEEGFCLFPTSWPICHRDHERGKRGNGEREIWNREMTTSGLVHNLCFADIERSVVTSGAVGISHCEQNVITNLMDHPVRQQITWWCVSTAARVSGYDRYVNMHPWETVIWTPE